MAPTVMAALHARITTLSRNLRQVAKRVAATTDAASAGRSYGRRVGTLLADGGGTGRSGYRILPGATFVRQPMAGHSGGESKPPVNSGERSRPPSFSP